MSQNPKYLIAFDTDQIKNYIFATNSLREIRGASALLVKIEEEREKDLALPEDAVVYSAGGSGAVEIGSLEEAESLKEKIEFDFQQRTVSGSITAIVVPPELDGKKLTFYQQRKEARKQMQQTKAAKAPLFQVPLEPYMQPCMACGRLPAELKYEDDHSGDLLCQSCSQKRELGKKVRQSKNEGYVKKFHDYVNNYVTDKDKANLWDGTELAKDLTKLAALDGSGYVGFIMLDGNNMGELLEGIEQKEHYRQYSNTLKQTVEHLVYETLLKEGKPIQGVLPFEIVLIGGDDIIIFTTAKLAMPFALAVLKGFEESTDQILEAANIKKDRLKKLTMSAGVVYAHGNFPIPALVEIGESLMKNAKAYADQYRQKSGEEVSAIDFMLVTGSMFDLETAKDISRAMRPFTRDSMEKLAQHASELDIPASQLHRIYEACVSGRLVDGIMATLQMMGRLRDGRQREKIKQVLDLFSIIPKEKRALYWPWTRLDGPEKHKSILVDLIDLHRFAK